MIQKAVSSTASLLLLILMGYFIGNTKVFRKNDGAAVLSNFLANWALPCFIFYNIYHSFSGSQELVSLIVNLPVPFVIITVMLAGGVLAARLFKIDPSRRGAFSDANAFSNTSFIGFPIITSLFGSQTLSVGMIYYIANTLLFFTLGTWLLSKDSGTSKKIFTKDGLKKIFSPMVLGLIFGICVKLLNIPLPQFLTSSLSYFTSVCPCLGMVFIGIVIRQNKIKKEYFFPDMVILVILKYIITPFVVGTLLFILPIAAETKAVFFILSFMPSITQMSIMSDVLGSDNTFCALWLTVSSTLGIAFIPALIYLAGNIFQFI